MTLATKGGEETPRMEESRREVRVVGRRGKHLVRAMSNLGQSTKIYRTVCRVSQRGHISRGPRDM